ncbi:MAG TPA: diguanylate cyclase [Candidatus Tenderia electrophaga]|uniref:diguanylate cyclase n=1 Tax=Candidatus Tenderia electrophaga TaxID=1748243 RepID=A0A832J5B2_9GAMM|nr:diguanylate cyclase [Candidatus Tenderia electrophaga]
MTQITLSDMQDALQNSPIGIILMDEAGNIQWHNNSLEQLLDVTTEQLSGKAIADLPKELSSVLVSPPETILLQHGDVQRWLHCHSQISADGKRTQFYIDITTEQRLRLERDRLEEDLQQLTTRDPVTGLPNRRALLQGLEPLISRSRRYGNPLSLIKLHVELSGLEPQEEVKYQEEAWMKVGQLLKEQMRWADIIGRYDGPEFLLILPETPADATETLAEKLCEMVDQLKLMSDANQAIQIKPYCGLTSWKKGDDANLMLQHISSSINDAKAAGTAIAKAS